MRVVGDDAQNLHDHPVRDVRGVGLLQGRDQGVDELAGALGQDKGQAILPLTGQVGGVGIPDIAEPLHRLLHPRDRRLTNARPRVEDAVDRRQANPRLFRDIVDGGLVHSNTPRKQNLVSQMRYVNQLLLTNPVYHQPNAALPGRAGRPRMAWRVRLAERVGFEPPRRWRAARLIHGVGS